MQIQINTDHNIKGHAALLVRLRHSLESSLSRISDHITRVEVHLSDENGSKNGQNDKRCLMEARLEGRKPIAVSCQAGNLDQAVICASDKLVKLIENTLGRSRAKNKHIAETEPPDLELSGE
jgi:hypothetical protein